MKDIISVKSNPFFKQREEEKQVFKLDAVLEIIIVHTNGKEYSLSKNSVNSKPKISESRFIVNSEMLSDLIIDLQLHQDKLASFRRNSEKINSLVSHIANISPENKSPENK